MNEELISYITKQTPIEDNVLNNLKPLMRKTKNPENTEMDEVSVTDEDWVFDSFMVKSTELSQIDQLNRYWSVAEAKFTDTSLGGSIPLNVYPQFTRYADIRVKGRRFDRNEVRVNDLNGNLGMGRYYAEVIDDNSFDVYFQFGVPEFKSLFSYILLSADYKKVVIANDGRSTFLYRAGQVWGGIAIFAGFGFWGLAAVALYKTVSTLLDVFAGEGQYDYYHVKETMFTYWSTVNSLVTMFATRLGIVTPSMMTSDKDPKKIGLPMKLDKEDLDFMRKYMPDIITGDNYIDVFSMVTKAQRLANLQFKKEIELFQNGVINDKTISGVYIKSFSEYDLKNMSKSKFFEYIRKHDGNSPVYGKNPPPLEKVTDKKEVIDPKSVGYDKDGRLPKTNDPTSSDDYKSSFLEHLKAAADGGALYAVFRVENPGQVSESFSNSVGDIELEGALKSIGSRVKNLKFDLAGGAIPGLDKIIKGITDFASGALDTLTFGLSNVLTVLLGGANLVLPKKWEDSSATFPEYNFKMRLVAPYGNPISQLRNIYIPLAGIMAGALPLATGPTSYASPFICKMFLRGYGYIKLGMITSLTITRGVSNLPFNKSRRPLAVDVSFTVTDFTKILSMPIVSDIGQEAFIELNQDSPINRYINTLTGTDLYNTVYFTPNMKLKLARLKANADMLLSNGYLSMKLYDAFVPEVIKDALEQKAMTYKELE